MFKPENIKLIISDVDGVLTDGSIYKGPNGFEMKKFSVVDGAAVALLRQAKIPLCLISGRKSEATLERAKELKIDDVYNGTLNKIPPYEELKEKYKINDDEIMYIGDDLIDIPIMEKVAAPIATNNACEQCKDIAIFITKNSGGNGAFREAVEWLLKEKKIFSDIIYGLRDQVQNKK
tara:strand:+ start:216 stop:746 length:531 start_codon:yes stop_codon:yes gene_type:complete